MWHAGDAPADVARVASATGTAARARRLGEDLDRARVVGAEGGLDGHVEVAERLDVMREGQRAGVDGPQAAVAHDLLDGVLGGVVVAREEDVELLARDGAFDQRAGEGGVEALHDLRTR